MAKKILLYGFAIFGAVALWLLTALFFALSVVTR